MSSPAFDPPASSASPDHPSLMLRGSLMAVEAMSRQLQTDSQGNPLQENAPTRVGDIGVGTFVLLLVCIIYIGWVFFRRAKRR